MLDIDTDQQKSSRLSDLCKLLDIQSKAVLSENDAGIRGMYPEYGSTITEGEALLSIPISSCLRDDSPPVWLNSSCDDSGSQWATRLAASLLDLQLQNDDAGDNSSQPYKEGKLLWLSMLPKSSLLRASLPIHWRADILESAKCQALELAVDSAYFGRASAVMDLVEGLGKCDSFSISEYSEDGLSSLCNDALDLVQTRTCRVLDEDNTNTSPLRILAPVFDFLNHGTNPNAAFGMESDLLVVRATRDIEPSEEILIDYGESSATPASKCLASYGFVPEFDVADERNTVELFVDGVRENVGGDSIPFELVEAASQYLAKEEDRVLEEGDNIFTPAVAMRIAERAAEEAQERLNESGVQVDTEEDACSLSLATALRLSQHKVFTFWSAGLKEYANQNS